MNATAVGSVHYISPEQARGGYCDERSDIYSFGITMYEMVTGRCPLRGITRSQWLLAHLEEPVTPPSQYVPDMSRAMEQIILKCTQKRPDRRYACVTDVIEDLRAALMDPDADIYARKDGEEDEFVRPGPSQGMSSTASRKAGRAIPRKPWRNRRRNSPASGQEPGQGTAQKRRPHPYQGKRNRGG